MPKNWIFLSKMQEIKTGVLIMTIFNTNVNKICVVNNYECVSEKSCLYRFVINYKIDSKRYKNWLCGNIFLSSKQFMQTKKHIYKHVLTCKPYALLTEHKCVTEFMKTRYTS